MSTEESPQASPDQAAFVSLFAAAAPRLYAYIYTQVAHPTDTDDIFQETSRVLWEKFSQFEPGTNFFAWACRTAEFQVLAHRQRQARNRLSFSDEFLAAVAAETVAESDRLAAQHHALAHCLEKLGARERELVALRYSASVTVKEISAQVGRSIEAVYKSLQRIHERLFECAQKRLAEEGWR